MILSDYREDDSEYFDAKVSFFDPLHTEQSLPDERASIRPSEAVQQKFLSHLSDMPVPVTLNSRNAGDGLPGVINRRYNPQS